jgi:Fe-S oxidoreductase
MNLVMNTQHETPMEDKPITLDDQALLINDEIREELIDLTGGAAAACFQCGVCTAICPWSEIREEPFDVRSLIRRVQLGIKEEQDDLWLCTTCGTCEASCPRGVDVTEVIRAMRFLRWKQNDPPGGLPTVLWAMFWDNNPFGQPPSERSGWLGGLEVELFDPGRHEVTLYIGCTASYDRRAQNIARSLVSILTTAGVSFGILGDEEPCCGETALSLGHLPFFREHSRRTLTKFEKRGVRRLVVLSPHCFDVFMNHYPESYGGFEPVHYSEFISELIADGRISLTPAIRNRVTFHDPCLLSRDGRCTEEFRTIIRAMPGIDFVEMPNHGAQTRCCGGGGGRMWLETAAGERFSDLRLREAAGTGAGIIATACPFCIACLEDSAKAAGKQDIQIMDISELLSLCI